ncbi:hypothetical protein, variant [Cladophialophora immunda]|uniref:RBR-type E3 ubiquitin transferase n=1 Tax=Cladophialophora immunda TaxID=569365 RepID=A0A0D2CHL8_9EURO|nr:uncharacterized protein PV07_05475 [Cladophialophora immunda]XP_016249896.1 hypothetical protein, variant [Cladophialophora immunda]KIW29679.1 hypothetical protein PV07_05475 [Cladophialophora immunda]KIW29680.1 hypothetical protein, variant [Cladophialophora immunda]
MAEYTAPFNNLDLETADLILKLQLEDIEDLRTSSKDKNRDGALIDAQVALSLFEENLESIRSVLSDRQMTQSIADAVRADAEVIADVIHEEEVACEDHTLAHRLNGTNVTSEVHLQSSELGQKTLARLAGLYVSEDVGHELFKGTKFSTGRDTDENGQPESSMKRSARDQGLHDTYNLRCIACHEVKKYFDVIEVPCGHNYCKPCLQELVDLATKDESLFPPRCCREPFEMGGVNIFLTKELRDQFEHAKVEFGTRNRTYCCQETCSAFITPGNIEGDRATCGKCGTMTCNICKKPAHDGHCPEDPELQATLSLATQSGWQRCYGCDRLIELDVGCNHITCRCGAQFCYVCGVRWKQCGCDQWNEDRLLARANTIVNRERPNMANDNPGLMERALRDAANMLRNRHNCTHTSWRYIRGRHHCEECFDDLPNYIFECIQCRIQACNRCRRNRL